MTVLSVALHSKIRNGQDRRVYRQFVVAEDLDDMTVGPRFHDFEHISSRRQHAKTRLVNRRNLYWAAKCDWVFLSHASALAFGENVAPKSARQNIVGTNLENFILLSLLNYLLLVTALEIAFFGAPARLHT